MKIIDANGKSFISVNVGKVGGDGAAIAFVPPAIPTIVAIAANVVSLYRLSTD